MVINRKIRLKVYCPFMLLLINILIAMLHK